MDTMPPKGTDLSRMLDSLKAVRDRVDGLNVPDMPSAAMRLSSLAVCRILLDNGYQPILQVTCRDRNRLALQSDLLDAAVLGVENVLVLGGDDVSLSDHPGAKGVFDLDTPQLLAAARGLERGVDMAGNPLQGKPVLCLGAAADPYAPDLEAELDEMSAKAHAGAEFFQTQPVFDVDAFAAFMKQAGPIGVPVLAGVFLLKSARMARFMSKNVPEVVVPSWVIRKLETASDPVTKSLAIAVETLRELRGCAPGLIS
jgi:5,10-methylenetetrahydrofolate reductase